MQISKTLLLEDNVYFIKIPASLNKAKKPVLQRIPEILKPFYDYYLEVVRPIITDSGNNESKSEDQGYVFVNNNSTIRRTDFSHWCKKTTLSLIGKAYGCHAFRSSVITLLYEDGKPSESETLDYSRILNHDLTTQKNYYVKKDWKDSCNKMNHKIQNLLLQPES